MLIMRERERERERESVEVMLPVLQLEGWFKEICHNRTYSSILVRFRV